MATGTPVRSTAPDSTTSPPLPTRAPRKVAVVGLSNSGKSQIFNNLTGEYSIVANYHATTIEIKRSRVRLGDHLYDVIDTPGLDSLYIHSEEEIAVRNLLLGEQPDLLIQCVDANRLKQSLSLTADLLELGIPMVVALNAIDETSRKGIWIDAARLSELLGVPVVESVALRRRGVRELKLAMATSPVGSPPFRYGDLIEEELTRLAALLPPETPFARKLALLFLLQDPFLERDLGKLNPALDLAPVRQEVTRFRRRYRGNLASAIGGARSRWVESAVREVVRTQRLEPSRVGQTLGALSRHPVYGIPILLAVLTLCFFLVVDVANALADGMNELLWSPLERVLLAIIPSGFFQDVLIGDYGLVSFGLANALLTVLPILSVFFLLFNVVEDTGYLPNMGVMTQRLLNGLGLSGASIMPLVLAFGCKTMATLTTRNLRSAKERYIAIYLIAFAIPCAAQLGLDMAILGRLGLQAFAIAFTVLAVGEVAAGMVLNRLLRTDTTTDYIQALPPMRLPNLRAVLVKTYYRLRSFVVEAVPVFVIAAGAMYAVDAVGLLDAAKTVLSPLIQGFLGLPLDMVDALILCIARHEAAAALIIRLIDQGQLNAIQCIVAVTVTTMFVPCFANIVAMFKELGVRRAAPMVVAINASAFVSGGAINWILVRTLG